MSILQLDEIRRYLNTVAIGAEILYFQRIRSTNDMLFVLGEQGYVDGTVVFAESQTQGRGRLGRKWCSPPGVNIYMSILFRPKIEISDSAVFTFLTSLAVKDVLSKIRVPCSIKWPNDIVCGGRKLAGVLTEMKPGRNGLVDFVVVGLGLNVNITMEEIQRIPAIANIATSIREVLSKEVDRTNLVKGIIQNMDRYYMIFLTQGVDSIVTKWVNRWGGINRFMKIDTGSGVIEGVARKVDRSGFLYLETISGELKKIVAGDVSY